MNEQIKVGAMSEIRELTSEETTAVIGGLAVKPANMWATGGWWFVGPWIDLPIAIYRHEPYMGG